MRDAALGMTFWRLEVHLLSGNSCWRRTGRNPHHAHESCCHQVCAEGSPR